MSENVTNEVERGGCRNVLGFAKERFLAVLVSEPAVYLWASESIY